MFGYESHSAQRPADDDTDTHRNKSRKPPRSKLVHAKKQRARGLYYRAPCFQLDGPLAAQLKHCNPVFGNGTTKTGLLAACRSPLPSWLPAGVRASVSWSPGRLIHNRPMPSGNLLMQVHAIGLAAVDTRASLSSLEPRTAILPSGAVLSGFSSRCSSVVCAALCVGGCGCGCC